MTINQIQDEIIEEYAQLDDWMDRYQLLIETGDTLPPLNNALKVPDNLIEGCQSRVWIASQVQGERMRFEADSDALITKGLAALVLRVFQDQPACAIAQARLYFIDRIGFTEHLSPTRSNGLLSMIQTIQSRARALCTALPN